MSAIKDERAASVTLAEPEEAPEAFSWRAILEIVQALALAVIISVFLNVFVVQVTEVVGRSMEPTLYARDRVLASKVDYRIRLPQRGEIVVFQPTVLSECGEGRVCNFVKRVVAVGGDVVDLRNGQLYVNGSPAPYPEAVGVTTAQSPQVKYPYTVPPHEFFALGDNREASSDSRSIGPQPIDRIVGKVILRFWPLDRLRFFGW